MSGSKKTPKHSYKKINLLLYNLLAIARFKFYCYKIFRCPYQFPSLS